MSIITSQQLSRYFEQFGRTEITFNRQVLDATGLMPNNVFLKVSDQQWPCIVYASSMVAARVIAGVRAAFFESLRVVNNHVSLRYSFKLPDKADPLSFFVPSRVTGYTQYNPKNPDVQLISLEFTQRPADDLIQALGILLEANANSTRRKEERIVLNPESIKKLGLESKESFLYVEGVPRKCIMRDISFGGAKVLVPGIAKFLTNKKACLKISRGEPAEEISINGEIIRVEDVEGRKDIVALGILFTGDVPMSYKLMINGFLTTIRRGSEPAVPRAPAAADVRRPAAAPKEPDAGAPQTPPPSVARPAAPGMTPKTDAG